MISNLLKKVVFSINLIIVFFNKKLIASLKDINNIIIKSIKKTNLLRKISK